MLLQYWLPGNSPQRSDVLLSFQLVRRQELGLVQAAMLPCAPVFNQNRPVQLPQHSQCLPSLQWRMCCVVVIYKPPWIQCSQKKMPTCSVTRKYWINYMYLIPHRAFNDILLRTHSRLPFMLAPSELCKQKILLFSHLKRHFLTASAHFFEEGLSQVLLYKSAETQRPFLLWASTVH